MPVSDNFIFRAELMGHSAKAIQRDGSVFSQLRFKELDELRKFMQSLHGHDKLVLKKNYENSPLDISKNLQIDRIHRHIMADMPLLDEDRKMIATKFPLTILASSQEDKILPAGETKIEGGTPVIWNFDTVTFKTGAFITTLSTSFTLIASNMIMQ